MPVDIDKLRRFKIPQGRQKLEPKDIALYGLSIGLGADPLDAGQLPFVDPAHGPAVAPSMVLVMAHPGFWMGHPDSGVDPTSVLHASQGFEILGPLPGAGDVTSQSRVTDVIDKGPGKAALIHTETNLTDAKGALFARLSRVTFVRGGGGFGGQDQAGSEREPEAAGAADFTIDLPTAANQALVYRLNGDLNPLHSDPDTARKAGFERPILHGLCTMGVVTHALLRALADYRAERLRSVRLRFSKPVMPGDVIRTEIWKNGRFRALVAARDVVVVDGGCAELVASL